MSKNVLPAVIAGWVLLTLPPSASAQSEWTDEQKAILRALECQAHHLCNLFPGGRPRKRNFRFQPGDEQKNNKRNEIEKLAEEGDLPSAEQEILSALNSAELSQSAKDMLVKVGAVLKHAIHADYQFALVGHTDARGGAAAYNRDRSGRRARSARRYLVDWVKISVRRITAYGRGERALEFPDKPHSARNRRM